MPSRVFWAACLLVIACGGRESADPPTDDSQPQGLRGDRNAVEPADALNLLRKLSAPMTLGEFHRLHAKHYRASIGTKYVPETFRLENVEKSWAAADQSHIVPPPGHSQLLISDGGRGLRISLDTRLTRGGRPAGFTPGARLNADHYRFELIDGAIKIAERRRYYDDLTAYRQARFEGLPQGPSDEQPWEGGPFEVAGSPNEVVASRIAKTHEFLDGYAASDAARVAATILEGFVDRDAVEMEAETFLTTEQFERSIASELGRFSVSTFDRLETWGTGEWVVARVRHAYRLSSELPRFKGTAGKRALSYELWLFRFRGESISHRWRFRDLEDQLRQLGFFEPLEIFPAPGDKQIH